MVSYDSLLQMRRLILDVDARSVKGAIVETGCWRGGCGAFMSWASRRNGSHRKVYLFDSFEGFPEPGVEDAGALRKTGIADAKSFKGYNTAAYDDAKRIAMLLDSPVTLIKGWFDETLPKTAPEIGPIAVLRLDGDLYESTRVALRTLYDQVADGGYVVIDDFGFAGCRQALYEFFAERGIAPEIRFDSPFERAYFRKEKVEAR